MGTSARIDELRKKFEENPRRYFAPLANEYRKSGDLEQAISLCEEYLPQQPGHMSGHIVYGQALFESGRRDDARAVFETALSLDPENLIALRHLGDIARSSGDPAGARGWYQRVLDADPRNDEITQLLSSLDSDSAVAPLAAAPSLERDRSTPLATTIVEGREDDHHVEERRDAFVDEIEKSEEALPSAFEWGNREPDDSVAGDLSDFDLPPVPPAHPAPAAETTTDDDLLDLDDFSIGGVASGSSGPPPRVEEPAPVGLDGDVTISGGFTIGTEDEAFEADSFAATAASPAPEPNIDLAADINLGLTPESASPAPNDAAAASLDGLETFEAGSIAGSPNDVPVLETEAFFDLPPVTESAGPASEVEETTSHSVEDSITEVSNEKLDDAFDWHGISEGSDTPDAALTPDLPAALYEPPPIPVGIPEPPEAFVTETMAELYIQQGHLDSALDIYRKLVEQRPDEPELHERLRAIEDRLFGTPAVTNAEYSTPPAYGGPTIREFLMGLISRTPTNGGRRSAEHVVDQSDDAEWPLRETRMTPGASETITGSIDALFSGASASASDMAAADALAAAFAETAPEPAPADSNPLDGTPAHRAPDELSLDHVFKAGTPPRQSGGANGFSFDQFFADEMGDPAGESAPEAAPGSPEATDDIAQFNAWLNGLKKT
jgi:tetratricopeptide (TPR) repeat protein